MNDKRDTTVVRRDTPLEGTHLTEMQLTEMWYDHMERVAQRNGTKSYHREHLRLFPRSRKDLIQYYTRLDLERQDSGQ